MTLPHPLPRAARLASHLIPAADRDAIVGDLIEDAGWRGLAGRRLAASVCLACAAIAAGLAVDRVRSGVAPAPPRELAAGLALDGTRALRHWLDAPGPVIAAAAAFLAGIVLLAASVEVVVSVLMTAAGLH